MNRRGFLRQAALGMSGLGAASLLSSWGYPVERKTGQSACVQFRIINNSQQNHPNSGLPNSKIYLFITQEPENLTWTIDPGTGVATPNQPGVLAPLFTLQDLEKAGGAIQVDSSVDISKARIYLSNSPNAVTNPNNKIAGPTASTAQFYYDFVEFTLSHDPATHVPNLNVDLTQVDQLGFPLTLQVEPNDPNFPNGSGIMPTLDRATLISEFRAMATGKLAPFQDCIFTDPNDHDTIYRLLNPSDVISSQLHAVNLDGWIPGSSGMPGNWQAQFVITGPGNPPPNNSGLAVGMIVSGPLIPAGTTISKLPGPPIDNTVLITSTSTQTTSPFTPTSDTVGLFFYNPLKTALSTYFDDAIDYFFKFYLFHIDTLRVEQNSGGKDVVYTGNVTEIMGIPDINGGTSIYTVLQFSGNGEIYNLYYPFFTTNSPAKKLTPYGRPVPPPPAWWNQGLNSQEPPSQMVFGADGVFADNTQQHKYAPNQPDSAIQGAIENVIVTALARGHATTWRYRTGTIQASSPPNQQAMVQLVSGEDCSNLNNQMYMYSFRIANVPMRPNFPCDNKASFRVTSPVPIPPTTDPPDLLSFAQFYPPGGTWSAFANFFHNGAGYNITIDGRAYALPFDDQGGFSSDLNSLNPQSVAITLGPWSP
jgi:hypothetical protein